MTTALKFLITAKDATGPGINSVSRNLRGLQTSAAGLRSALGGLAPALAGALSISGVAAFVKSANDGLIAIKDLSEATGASIENISGLENVARAAGGSIEDVSGVLIKFNMALKDADGKNAVSQALKAIGLDAAELRRQDPAQALQQTALALSQFADDGNKARLVQELFGKSIKDAGPLLKELAEAGKIVGTVTAEQVKQADLFNKQLAAMQANVTDLARDISGPLVSSLNQFFDAITGKGVGGAAGITSAIVVPLQAVSRLGANVAFVFRGIGIEIGGIAAQAASLLRGDFSGAKTIGKLMEEDAKAARAEFDALERRLMSIGRVLPQASYSNEGRQGARSVGDLVASRAPAAKPGAKVSAPKLPEMDEQVKAWEDFIKSLRSDAASSFAATRTPLEKLNIELARQQELLDRLGPSYRDTYERAVFAAQEAADAAAEVPEAVTQAIVVQLDEIDAFAKQAAENIQDALGDTLTATLAGDFDNIGDLWENMIKRMVSEAAAAQIMKALIGDGAGGTASGVSDILGLLINGFSAAPRADGGPVSAGTPYLVGERGPEIIVPRSAGTVLPNGTTMGGGISYSVNVLGDASENTLRLIGNALAQFEARQMRRAY